MLMLVMKMFMMIMTMRRQNIKKKLITIMIKDI